MHHKCREIVEFVIQKWFRVQGIAPFWSHLTTLEPWFLELEYGRKRMFLHCLRMLQKHAIIYRNFFLQYYVKWCWNGNWGWVVNSGAGGRHWVYGYNGSRWKQEACRRIWHLLRWAYWVRLASGWNCSTWYSSHQASPCCARAYDRALRRQKKSLNNIEIAKMWWSV